ncbi:MAG: quinol oxidase [Desulfuromonadaceae bacterium]|nr:quinol oxidase [Desulfuromonadaceae bacterium]
MKFRNLMFSVTGILLLTAIAGIVNGEDQSAPTKAFQAIVAADSLQKAEIVGGSYFFTPNRIILKVNIPVELKIRKEPGIVPHNIIVSAPEAGIVFDAPMENEATVIRFTPTKVGSYPFYCNKKLLFFQSHREKGMEGVLEVVE